ncbi:MAG: DNA-directed RNA polymerase subunit D [Candidatus Korarchaeum sp.]|nr:DNA-directed RNA polymerase subunit D [Candidatus Korarchaeum sp.]MDW8035431.1 DNA-directed RNA polymerase subunit D [Candidatus Korarchaeum sp.]
MIVLKVRVIELSEEKAFLVLEGITPSLANSIRRAIIGEVPTFAIDEVIIFENTTPFFDEYIAHRLAMIPLKTSLDLIRVDPSRTVVLELSKKAKELIETVYSGELKSSDPLVYPANERIPIIKMRKGQKIRFQAVARLGKGKDHSKWSPAAAVGYSYMPIYELIDPNLECDLSSCSSCMESDGDVIRVDYPTLCKGCWEALENCRVRNPNKIVRRWDESRIIIRYESTGSMRPDEIFLEAINQMKAKLSEFLSVI